MDLNQALESRLREDVLKGDLAGVDETSPPGRFGVKKRRVCFRHEIVAGLSILRGGGHADTEGDGKLNFLVIQGWSFMGQLNELLSHLQSRLLIRSWHEYHELITIIADG